MIVLNNPGIETRKGMAGCTKWNSLKLFEKGYPDNAILFELKAV